MPSALDLSLSHDFKTNSLIQDSLSTFSLFVKMFPLVWDKVAACLLSKLMPYFFALVPA